MIARRSQGVEKFGEYLFYELHPTGYLQQPTTRTRKLSLLSSFMQMMALLMFL